MQLSFSNIILGVMPALALLPGVEAQSARSMGFIGCSMAENVAQGYVAVGGTRMWGPYGTGGAVNGKPSAVWVQICIFSQNGATYDEVKKLIANARQHAAPGAEIFITGQPMYDAGQTCFLAGQGGPELTDNLAKRASEDASLNATYGGTFRLHNGEVADGCHANTVGQQSLGRQAIGFWG
ncbi:hypothetical protein CGCS363_v010592 [Colletotrichum siamense]|uniref:uncharacterized protein n=1 Tax=Colletotrichum siamense TaxID=690259 RepID=UPI0018727787|nr:uncharacterized protein CGCS363_v010592 [Colletotrichum siamense]KAF5492216.1 hypothetical protein CGCS363_v010592 [Colletotrichum siamense]